MPPVLIIYEVSAPRTAISVFLARVRGMTSVSLDVFNKSKAPKDTEGSENILNTVVFEQKKSVPPFTAQTY